MSNTKPNSPSRMILVLLLLLGGGAYFFSNGLFANVIAAWIAPILLLRFSRLSKPLIGFISITMVAGIANFFMFQGMFPMEFDAYIGVTAISGIFVGVSYLLDRLISPSLPRFWASLVFPCVMTAGLFLASSGNPFGTWGNDSYVQLGFLPLAQVASVIGLWGVFFLVSWFAAGVNDVWQTGPKEWRSSRAPMIMGAIAATVLMFGGSRLLISNHAEGSISVAALTNTDGVADKFFEGCTIRDDYECRNEKGEARHDILFSQSKSAADAGAELIVWYEAAAQYDAQFETAFYRRAQDFAKSNGVYFVFGAAKIPNDPDALLTNKAVMISPDGKVVGEYLKANPVPGEPIIAGDTPMLIHDALFGRIGVVICFDADFTETSKVAGTNDVDLLIVPSNDWEEIASVHAEMAVFRGIESGASIVRATSNGVSIISDPVGRVIARQNSFTSNAPFVFADLRIGAMTTLYPVFGNGFAVLASLILLVVLLWRIGLFFVDRSAQKPK